jgi:hypothetical protein
MAGETDQKTDDQKAAEAAEKAKKEADAKAAADGDNKQQKTVPHEALHAEREEHKKTKERLAALEAEKAETARKAEEEKGNFKKLYEDSEAAKKALEAEIATHKTKVGEFEEKAQKRIDKALESVKAEADKATIKNILEGKSLAAQEDLLPTLLEKFGVPANVNAGPKGSGGGKGSATDRETKEAEAKKSGDVRSMIANAPRL